MPTLPADDARDLARQFGDLAYAVHVYRIENWKKLKPRERSLLEAFEWNLLSLSSDLVAQAVIVTMQDLHATLKKINDATAKATAVLKTIKDVQKAVTIVAAAAGLAAAIATGNAGAIVSGAQNLASTLST